MEQIPQFVEETTTKVVDAILKVHKELGPGLLENAYEACLKHELQLRGLDVKTQVNMPITYNGLVLENAYRIDMLINDCLIIEVKVIESIQQIHRAQLLTYLKFSKHRLGLLVNFNTKLIKDGIERLAR